MKSLLMNAVASAIAIGTLSSCGGLGFASNSDTPRLLTKAQARSGFSWARTSNSFLPAKVDLAVKASTSALPKDKHGRPTYNSDRVRHRVVRTTSYSHQEGEVGAPGRLNAIGSTLKYGQVRSAAADWSRYPVGTTFKIKGLPHRYVIDDFGSSLAGTNTIDIYHPTLGLMRRWATRDVEINIIKWGSLERAANLLRTRTKYRHCAQMYYAAMRKLNSSRVVQTRRGAAPTL